MISDVDRSVLRREAVIEACCIVSTGVRMSNTGTMIHDCPARQGLARHVLRRREWGERWLAARGQGEIIVVRAGSMSKA